jgi:hypothetical protein
LNSLIPESIKLHLEGCQNIAPSVKRRAAAPQG